MKVLLYTTLGCHLCEQAHDLLLELQTEQMSFQIETVEIADSDTLVEQYGIRIPVVKIAGLHTELGWPFDATCLAEFLTP